jgi:hypothetical protein
MHGTLEFIEHKHQEKIDQAFMSSLHLLIGQHYGDVPTLKKKLINLIGSGNGTNGSTAN